MYRLADTSVPIRHFGVASFQSFLPRTMEYGLRKWSRARNLIFIAEVSAAKPRVRPLENLAFIQNKLSWRSVWELYALLSTDTTSLVHGFIFWPTAVFREVRDSWTGAGVESEVWNHCFWVVHEKWFQTRAARLASPCMYLTCYDRTLACDGGVTQTLISGHWITTSYQIRKSEFNQHGGTMQKISDFRQRSPYSLQAHFVDIW